MTPRLLMGLQLSVKENRERLRHAEHVLAPARVFLAASSLAATYMDPTNPSRHASLAYAWLIAYLGYCVAVAALLRIRKQITPRFLMAFPIADILWPAVISLFTQGPNSPYFLFFIFAILASSYRWGLPKAMLSTAILALALIVTATQYDPVARVVEAGFDLNQAFMRAAAYLVIIGFLAGYLGEKDRQSWAELSAVARIIGKAKVQSGLTGTMKAILDEILRIVESERTVLVFQELSSERVFLWDASREDDNELMLVRRELDLEEREQYLFALQGETLQTSQPKKRPALEAFVPAEGQIESTQLAPPETFLARYRCRRMLATSFRLADEWAGSIFLFDPSSRGSWAAGFLRRLIVQVAPAVYNIYLSRRLRSRVAELERARVARQLHDSAIQELAAIEMHLYALRSGKIIPPGEMAAELRNVQMLVHNQIMSLRELMQQLSPLESDPKQLVAVLAGIVERFRDTGISARFTSDLNEVSLSPHTCRELAQILREALVNVRKHSDARNVLVRFALENGAWKLMIEDDGRGFDFSGRACHLELVATQTGPWVIKERVRSIGGELTIESRPFVGARVEVTLPQRPRVTHA